MQGLLMTPYSERSSLAQQLVTVMPYSSAVRAAILAKAAFSSLVMALMVPSSATLESLL